MSHDLDYIFVLKAIQEIPFNVGKKLLVDVLRGNITNDSVTRNDLDSLDSFGALAYEPDEIHVMIDRLIMNHLIRQTSIKSNQFWKVLELTLDGEHEIVEPSLHKKKVSYGFEEKETIITSKDREIFAALDSFLHTYNDEQKKAIICDKDFILCIAGAGSGKTTVLSKRVEFLTKYKSVNPKSVLAITFTRKARQEMTQRMSEFDPDGLIQVETFNSFCEKFLQKHNDLAYDKQVRLISYRDKYSIMNKALTALNTDMSRAIALYFTFAQRKGKADEQLATIFMNDCFFVRDYFRYKNKALDRSLFMASELKHKQSADLVYRVCSYIEEHMLQHGLRDFADQLLDTIAIFKQYPKMVPKFDHILIDEYQDVNSTQIEFVDLLNSKSIFCVGDPRQSIFGWRGSDIKYILDFEKKYPDCEIVSLVKNYRSTQPIVNLMNKAIEPLGLPDLKSHNEGKKDITLLKFSSETTEFEFVIQNILASNLSRQEIFVLARTNRQLTEISKMMRSRQINHIVRSDEQKKNVLAGPNDVTLATIHSIKGLEADMVFVIGVNGQNFPCKGSEHPVIDMVKVDEYDQEEEERRLFYVGISRARKTLFLTYSGTKHTHFITSSMLSFLEEKTIKTKSTGPTGNSLMARLKDWRKNLSLELEVPAYVLMHDRTLIDLAQRLPSSLQELEEVHGFGPTKIMKYGEEILDIIQG